MTKKVVSVEVSDKAYDLGQSFKKLVGAADKALEDGFQPGQDVPVIVLSAAAEVVTIVEAIKAAGGEAKEDLAAFIAALGLGVKDIAAQLLKKD